MSCNSNEPEIGNDNGIVVGGGINENPDPTEAEDLTEDPYENLDKASWLYFNKKDDEETLVVMYKIVDKYKDYKDGKELFVAKQVLVMIENIFTLTFRAKEIIPMLEKYSQGDSRFAKFAHYRKSYEYNRQGNYNKAIEIMKETEFSEEDADMRQARLYDLGVTYHNLIGDKEEGYKYFKELIDTYPGCPLAMMAKAYLP
jgi:tetratricopeptide (TPR) repeat protein